MTTLINNPGADYGQLPSGAATVQEFQASAAISAGQIVVFTGSTDTSLTVGPGAAATSVPAGVAINGVATGEFVRVVTAGPAKAVASTTSVAAGIPFSCNASGQITTASVTAGQKVVGFVLLAASGTEANAMVWVSVAIQSADAVA